MKEIGYDELPEPFRTYWYGDDALKRGEFIFYLHEDELYIAWGRAELAEHWTNSSCAGIMNFVEENNIEVKRLPLIDAFGRTEFHVVRTGDYETSAVHPTTGESWIVHSG